MAGIRMKKPPYFPFYPKDFAADDAVEAMSTLAVGSYILLLCKAWHQSPPASLPNDDRVLARYARLSPDDWQVVKPEVLAAFTVGNDDRLHQKRLRREYEAFAEKSKKRANAAAARWERSNSNANAMQMHSKCNAIQSQSQNQKKEPPKPPGGGVVDGFDAWYAAYPHKVGKAAARKAYTSARGRTDAATLLAGLEAYKRSKPQDRPWCNPATWLNQDRWEDKPADGGKAKPKTGIAALSDAQQAELAAYAKKAEQLDGYPIGAEPVRQAMRKHLDAWRRQQ